MSIERFVVSRDDSIYEAFPDLILTEKGKLICVFTECNHHHDRNNSRLVIKESYDRGRSWSEKIPLTEVCPARTRFDCARISRINDGRLAIICNRNNPDKVLTSVQYLWFGDSEGEHWDEPIVLPFWGIVPDKFLQLKNGRMIVAAHTPDESQRLEQFLWYSDDNGKTWSDRVTVASDPRYNLCEISIVPIDDNTLVAFLRENSAKGYDMFKTISYDNGETWSDLIETPFGCGHRPTAGLLQDGRLMVTYRYMAPPMHNFFAGFLDKDSILATTRRGHKSRIMPLAYDRNKVPDMGYSGWVQFPDGEIYVVYYIKDDSEKGNIRGLSMTLDDIEL